MTIGSFGINIWNVVFDMLVLGPAEEAASTLVEIKTAFSTNMYHCLVAIFISNSAKIHECHNLNYKKAHHFHCNNRRMVEYGRRWYTWCMINRFQGNYRNSRVGNCNTEYSSAGIS